MINIVWRKMCFAQSYTRSRRMVWVWFMQKGFMILRYSISIQLITQSSLWFNVLRIVFEIRRKSNYNLQDSTIVKICISYAPDFGFVIYCLKTKNMIDVCHEIHTLKNRLGKKTRYIIRYFKNICNNYSAD